MEIYNILFFFSQKTYSK